MLGMQFYVGQASRVAKEEGHLISSHHNVGTSTSRLAKEEPHSVPAHHTSGLPKDKGKVFVSGRGDSRTSHSRNNWIADGYLSTSLGPSRAVPEGLERQSAQCWKMSSILPPKESAIDSNDSRHIKGLVTAIDAIDNIIGPRKPKSKSRAKSRSERTAFCEKCGSTFTSVGNLNRHRRVSHQGVRVYCDFKGCRQVC